MQDFSTGSGQTPATDRALPKVIPPRITLKEPAKRTIRTRRVNPLARAGTALTIVGALVAGVCVPDNEDTQNFESTAYKNLTYQANPDYSLAGETFAGSRIAAIEGVHGAPSVGRYLQTDQTLGHDVSGHQGAVDWKAAADGGAKFVYVKATEGTGFINPQYDQQYNGSHDAGIIRGAYHFARPDVSDGATQANYFIDHGGNWTKDGTTLPGALDVEYNPYGETCYGLSPEAMSAWIKDFTKTYLARVHRSAVIYTSTNWWNKCTGNNGKFGNTNPLWLARYAPEIGPLPAGWQKQSIWQFANAGNLPGDQNYYNGAMTRVEALAKGK